MNAGVILLNFGEPESATHAEVVAFLERIFALNAALEASADAGRARELAERRAPSLLETYRAIGGSPLNAQARAQAAALTDVLRARGVGARAFAAFQFTEPTIARTVDAALTSGVTSLIGLPVHPLCGPTTTVAALRELAATVDATATSIDYREISGWHAHPLYLRLRADGIVSACEAAGIDPNDGRTRLVFSAHGTPLAWLRAGSRYDAYVKECCARVAALAGVRQYVIGYQNHTNRPVEWTQPDIEHVIRTIDAAAVMVVPISFMHEQSETLAELDIELRAVAEGRGLNFHRVPVPHDDARFAHVLADLVIARLNEGPMLRACTCRPDGRTRCATPA